MHACVRARAIRPNTRTRTRAERITRQHLLRERSPHDRREWVLSPLASVDRLASGRSSDNDAIFAISMGARTPATQWRIRPGLRGRRVPLHALLGMT
jgi:hypothetical protein